MARTELYTFADPTFFDSPARWDPDQTSFSLVRTDLPEGWRRGRSDIWETRINSRQYLPDQGWKIHVSATSRTAVDVLDIVADHCFGHGISFKFLRTQNLLFALNAKYAPRAASGKFITIYPSDDRQLEVCLTELAPALDGREGPYILTDLRYGTGPLYVRYGGFRNRRCWTEDGELVLSVRNPDGYLIPDERRPTFTVPPWVQVPAFLEPHLAVRKATGPTFGYSITAALHFSNAGGVYLGVRQSDGVEVVLKEARPLAGVDQTGRDAIARLEQEAWALRRLAGVPGIPLLHEVLDGGGHRFLVMERRPGITLQRWVAAHYPLVNWKDTAQRRRAYLARVDELLVRLHALVDQVHSRGMVFGDLHPANILVDDDDAVSLVDFELASEAADDVRPVLGHAGFHGRTKTGIAVDEHAIAAVRLFCYLPAVAMLSLAPDKAADLVAAAQRIFELPDGVGDALRGALREPDRPGAEKVAAVVSARTEVDLAVADVDWTAVTKSMVEAIHATATPQRTDRLFPGDAEQVVLGGSCFGYGAAGVLWALSVTSGVRVLAYEEWLLACLSESADRRGSDPLDDAGLHGAGFFDAGFYSGAHGVAFTLDHLGYCAEAERLVERAGPLVARMRGITLFDGLAGVGLNLLHLARGAADHPYVGQAVAVAEQIWAAVEDGAPHGIDRLAGPASRAPDSGTRGGLLRGWSGPALLFLELHRTTGSAEQLRRAVGALHRDLDLCRTTDDETMQVDGGFRYLPYLDIGSAGIALVGAAILDQVDDDRIAAALGPLSRACRSRYVADAQLFNGRAGLLAVAAALADTTASGTLDPDLGSVAKAEHLDHLRWHALAYRGHVAFPGEAGTRLSMDVATGTAGVLLAVSAATGHGHPVLPFLPG